MTCPNPTAPLLSLPPDVRLEFLAEGAANIVYRILAPSATCQPSTPPTEADLHILPTPSNSHTTPPPSEIAIPTPSPPLSTSLLRLRKSVPWTHPYPHLSHLHSTLLTPLLPPSLLISHTLILLPPNLLRRLNTSLLTAERTDIRAPTRRGVYLDEDESHGFLVTDMLPDAGAGEVLVEVKPKWLAQSRDAPGGARRCRTCAVRGMRMCMRVREGWGGGFCPLDLGSGEREGVGRAVQDIMGVGVRGVVGEWQERRVKERLVEFFMTTGVFGLLRELQERCDGEGVLRRAGGEVVSDDFLVAMTLRDCTLFVKVPADEEGEIEARLGDLDVKMAGEGKLEYWKGIERSLIDGGWYVGVDGEITGCRLERRGSGCG